MATTRRKRYRQPERVADLQDVRQRLELALQSAGLGVWDCNAVTGDCVFNARWAEMLGHRLAEIEPHLRAWTSRMHPDDEPHARQVVDACVAGPGDRFELEFRLRARTGEWRWILDRGLVVERGADGRARRMVGTHLDVTDRKLREEREAAEREARRQEEMARRQAQRLALHAETLNRLSRSDTMQRLGLDAALREVTETAARVLNCERVSVWLLDEARAKLTLADLFERTPERHGAGLELVRAAYLPYFEALDQDRVIAAHDAHRDPRTACFSQSYLAPLRIGAMLDAPIRAFGRRAGVVCNEHVGDTRAWRPDEEMFAASLGDLVAMLLESDHRRRAEASQARLAAIIEASPDFVGITSVDLRLLYVNRAGRALVGIPEGEDPTGTPLAQVHPAHAYGQLAVEAIPAALRTGAWSGETLLRGPGDREIPVSCVLLAHRDAAGKLLHLSTVMRDLSGLKRAQEVREHLETQLRHAQKMEALGTLAGGVAHDFNNVLAVILGNAELAQLTLPDGHEARGPLGHVIDATDRAAGVVKQILKFSRRHEQKRAPLALATVAGDVLRLLRASLPSSIELATELSPRDTSVVADPVEVHQVLMNLCANASHAMSGRGQLRVSVVPVEVSDDDARRVAGLRAGRHVRLSVADDGAGMDEATLERIFEPFFTTKSPGDGTGLGLAVVHGIVASHGGAVDVASRPGQGSTFDVYFPAAGTGDKALAGLASPVARGQGQRVLFVDDEEPVLRMGTTLLERLGYRVASFTRPRDAIAAVEADPRAFDAVLTDLTMPGMSGLELARLVRAHSPGVPVVLATGFAGTWDRDALQQEGIKDLLMKPFTARALGDALARALR